LILLRRIAGDDDLSGPNGVKARASARGLQTRHLVKITRTGGVWRASVTDAGRFYLEHGYHPDRPDRAMTDERPRVGDRSNITKAARGPATATDRGSDTTNVHRKSTQQAAVGVFEQAVELIQRLQDGNGTVQIESPDDTTRGLYRRVINAAKQHNLVPGGFHLKHTGRDSGDIVIRLTEDKNPDDTDWNRIRLNTRRVTTDPSLVFSALEKDPASLEVSEASLSRAMGLVHALADEARLRGHHIGVNKKTKHPKLDLQVGQVRRSVTLHEEYDKVPHVPTDQERRELRRSPWRTAPEFDEVPSGRLRLEIARAGWNNKDTWTDSKKVTLEKRLRQVIRDVESGIAADEQARLTAQRAAEVAAAKWRQEEEQEHSRWQAAIADARVHAIEKLRKDAFRKAYGDWLTANEIRAFCTALEQTDQHAESDENSTNLAKWLAWAQDAADRIDPTCEQSSLAQISFDVEPRPDDLRPFLGDWSPHRPQTEFRTESDEKRLADIRLDAVTWHPGMRGRPTWWRK
jgi:hypothetical protein